MAESKNKSSSRSKSPQKPESVNKKIQNGKEKKAKSKKGGKKGKKGFFSDFNSAMKDDFKGTFVILAVFFAICGALKTIHPVSICVSGSMIPVFYRGDILIASGWKKPNYDVGDIVMWKVGRSPTIVHRIISKTEDGHFLTKGDNNAADDTGLYHKYGHPQPTAGLTADMLGSQIVYHLPKIGYPIMLAKENMAITCIVSLAFSYLWTRYWKKEEVTIGEMAYNILSTVSVLMLAKRLEV
ncbi:putative signal peptidase I [Monocercomonoides exilis]|uniref:putative signal peptidase I n=1 Tax=Monocercomonoides exilis TaxID=2049356 RepID=UPI00355AC6E2|nr:putative signal peptidase I [Monocercomonoides exilis]|eukprot:MONOS_7808.1-p1 / transcript=MONOS_7808.1 / gene=MONOS_7808 / organism=Monocercomonoides_exilis_PA203 / gene_product=unspecified product / transcript_product=unspecified product / location=Mono_scaffold00277:22094-23032(-) / protein_length=239 / sequence_SO=supercontig / SO=protein_coding / is_pseudo=false